MIPTSLLAGLIVGALVHDRVSLKRSVVFGVGASALWGIGVGVNDHSLATLAGGTGLAFANLTIGGAVGTALRRVSSPLR